MLKFLKKTALFLVLMTAAEMTYAKLDYPEVEYGTAYWSEQMDRGSQRAIVEVTKPATAVVVNIPWRRNDIDPQKKGILVFDSRTGKEIEDVRVISVTGETGTIAFAPTKGPGRYEIYFMPYKASAVAWGKPGKYIRAISTASKTWLKDAGLSGTKEEMREVAKTLPQANLIRIEAREVALLKGGNDFNRMDPMQVVATNNETNTLKGLHQQEPFLTFPEDRSLPIRMFRDLPVRWIKSGPTRNFSAEVRPGEFYPFQIGIWAHQGEVKDLKIEFSDLKSGKEIIPAAASTLFNAGGSDWRGQTFSKTISVESGKVQTLWVMIEIPDHAAAGTYKGTWQITSEGAAPVPFDVSINVSGLALKDHGVGDSERLSRLQWLNSRLGINDEVVPPYIPIQKNGNVLEILNRKLELGANGLPTQIWSNERKILSSPITFSLLGAGDEIAYPEDPKTSLVYESPAKVTFRSEGVSEDLKIITLTTLEADGFVDIETEITAVRDLDAKDIRLIIPITSDVAKYQMGFGTVGEKISPRLDWMWSVDRAVNMGWFGDYNAGMGLKLCDSKDFWGMTFHKVPPPQSWFNDGKGGVVGEMTPEGYRLSAFTGSRKIAAGQKEKFRSQFFITPFKEIDNKHWNFRFASESDPDLQVKIAKEKSAIYVHHAAPGYNVYYNYPFFDLNGLRKIREDAGKKGAVISVYNTIRELSIYASELWAIRSLQNEVFSEGGGLTYSVEEARLNTAGGGYPWLMEHLVEGYTPGWRQVLWNGETDASVEINPMSRWDNFYVEGINFLQEQTGIQGIYLDGIGYDRETMKRVAKVMNANNPDYHISFHSGNNFVFADLRLNVLAQNIEHLPYVTNLWLGEMFEYENASPAYYLVELSGIPFGLGSEQLGYEPEKNNLWRGMLFGMRARFSPAQFPLFELWDAFGIQDAEMIGWWDSACPVQTNDENVLATVYSRPGKAMIAVASWSKTAVPVSFKIDWTALGLDPTRTKVKHPKIDSFQEEASVSLETPITVEPNKGFILLLEEDPL